MKLKLQVSLFLIVMCMFQACTTETNTNLLEYADVNGKQVPIYRFDLIEDSATVLPYSVLFEDIEIIPLETKDECLIAYGDITMTDHSILVSAVNRSSPVRVYEFDLEGKFVREFGSPGKGPGEHGGNSVDQLHYYPEADRIQISFNGYGGSQEFDLDGNFIRSISPPYRLTSSPIRISEETYFLTSFIYGKAQYRRDSFRVAYFRPDGSWIGGVPRRNYPDQNNTGYLPVGSRSVWHNGEFWCLHNSSDDTIYQVGNEQIIPEAICRFGESHTKAGEVAHPDTEIGRFIAEVIMETKDFIYIKKEHMYHLDINEMSPGFWGGIFLNGLMKQKKMEVFLRKLERESIILKV